MRGATVSAVAGAFALALVSGCSPVKGLNDGGGDDDDDDDVVSDASGPDAAWERGNVTVQVLMGDGSPAVGVRVVFNEPDGSVASTQNTDGSGRASFALFPQSSVTVATSDVFDETFAQHNLRTILGVMPGDNIVVGQRMEDFFGGKYMGDVRMDIRALFGTSSQYELRIGCETIGASGTGQIDWQLFQSTCNGGLEPVDVIATARDSDYIPVAFSTHLGVQLDAASYTLINSWRTDWNRLTIEMTNPPDGMSFAQGQMSVWRRGLDYSLGDPAPVALGGDSISVDMLYPPAFAERLTPQVFGYWGTFPDDIDGFSQYQRQTAANTGTLAVDLAADLPPRILSVEFVENGLDDAEVQFEVADEVSDLTAGAGSIQWQQTIPGIGGNPDTEINWEWFFLMPADTESPVQLPNIPPGSLPDGAWPPPAAVPVSSSVVGFLQTNLVSDWDDLRQSNGFALLDDPIGPNSPTGSEIALTVGGLIGFD